MNVLTPSGRLSKVEKGEKIFQIQTEFFHRPKLKITSTVILNGETLNKIETPWDEKLATDDDLVKIEKAVRKQHQQVIQMVKDQEGEKDKISPDEPSGKESWERLSEVIGIENLVVIDSGGSILFNNVNSSSREALLKILNPINKLANFLSQSTRLGDFLGSQIKTEREKLVWIYHKDQLYIAFLSQYMDFDSFSEKIKKLNWSKS